MSNALADVRGPGAGAPLDRAARAVGEILHQATQAFGGDAAGLLEQRGNSLVVTASSQAEAREADQRQLSSREGPAVGFHRSDVQVSGNLRCDTRWPTWGPAAAQLGWLSMLTAPLVTPRGALARLTLYARRPSAFDDRHAGGARFFAQYAATAWASATEMEGLRAAVDARHRVGLAQGILMERYDLDADAAFQVLCRYSQDHNVKLRLVAQHVITTRELPPEPALNALSR